MQKAGASRQGLPNNSKAASVAVNIRVIFFALLGVIGLLLKARYSGPWREIVHDYGGNLSASFAVYFVMSAPFPRRASGRLAAAGVALAIVEMFEALDGFGLMQNVYDPVDFAVNAAGIALALAIDAATSDRAPR